MRSFLGLPLAIVLAMVAISGCGPALTEEELGTVVFEIPQIPDPGEDQSPPQGDYSPADEVLPDADAPPDADAGPAAPTPDP
ncbi:MAG: hypothetical protein ACYTG0_19590 [Planctomycetota bacterium]|jgi:hypothetical protein